LSEFELNFAKKIPLIGPENQTTGLIRIRFLVWILIKRTKPIITFRNKTCYCKGIGSCVSWQNVDSLVDQCALDNWIWTWSSAENKIHCF